MEKDREVKKYKEKDNLNDQVNDPKENSGSHIDEPLKDHMEENKEGLARTLNEQIGGTDDRVA